VKAFLLETWCILRGHRWGPWASVPVCAGGRSPELVLYARYCGRCQGMDMSGDPAVLDSETNPTHPKEG
jgi:hypothetical protein